MSEQPTRADRTRQVVVVVSHLVGVLGVLTGVGVIGTEVSESSSGTLSADATLLAPAGTAFSIWSLIYALLTAYAIYQLFPSTATDPGTGARATSRPRRCSSTRRGSSSPSGACCG
ncbi:hypothetical protein [Janibacter melonis]|uniref:hypothetical protein n=1 Tax=Janibacter melonis TaxID=262209 RepID=UPI002094F739|nr:hypothetical protein [Janibacter melonis]